MILQNNRYRDKYHNSNIRLWNAGSEWFEVSIAAIIGCVGLVAVAIHALNGADSVENRVAWVLEPPRHARAAVVPKWPADVQVAGAASAVNDILR